MKSLKLIACFCLALLSFTAFSQDVCEPVGWATQNGGVTGGGNATPVVVNNYNDFKDAVTDENVKVVHISGTITFPSNGKINFQDQSDKTLFGLPGSKLVSTDQTSGGSGIFNAKRLDNVIFQNIVFEGPGAYDVDGNDNMTIDDSRNIWVDHCEFRDGTDGNLDIKNKSDFISVTWCTFKYLKSPIPDGPGGSDDHRYSNLFGSSDGATGDRGKLRITMQYCHWGEGVVERMPRVRYGKVHMVNNLFDSDVNKYCIRLGFEADVRAEGNVFVNQRRPVDEFDNDYTAIYANNNSGLSNMSKGSGFTPPYSIAIADPNTVTNPIRNCAGATLSGPGQCSACGGGIIVTPTPTVNLTSPSSNISVGTGEDVYIEAQVSDPDAIQTLRFEVDGNQVGETEWVAPYFTTFTPTTSGTYEITAVITLPDNGGEITSDPIAVTVSAPQTDCNGVANGSAYLDQCGECVGGNTGKEACTPTCNTLPKFGITGFATMNGGTTGGAGGDVVTVSNGVDLQNAIKDANGPRIIYVDGVITPENSTGLSKIDIKDAANISIIGLANGELDGIGLKVWRASNIIIQNLTIHHVLTGDKDGLNIEGPSNHIWVDHCEFYNEYQGVGKDYYDALLDLKRDVDYVTISWNYFHDSWKCSLSGSSESDIYERTVTYHHNHYENINSRLPLFRSGTGHMFNNYYKDIASTTINSRINACVRVENNHFVNAQNPYVSAYSDVVGYGEIIGNILENSPFNYQSDVQELGSCTANIPYNYTDYLNCVDNVQSLMQYAGVNPDTNQVVVTDCHGTPNGSASYDECGVCSGGETGIEPNSTCKDCHGDINGTASIDQCNICSGGNTGIEIDACIDIDCNGDANGTAYLDDCGVCVAGNTGMVACSSLIQGETACSIDGIQLESSNEGFLGQGYANTDNVQGASASWIVESDQAKQTTIRVRYANGGSTARDANVFVNNSNVGTLNLPSTGAWTTWNTASISIPVTSLYNDITLTASSADGLANIDALFLYDDVSDGNCSPILSLENGANSDLQLYPNPVIDQLHISRKTSWILLSLQGASIASGNEDTIDLSDFTPGVYMLTIEGKVYKVVKE